MRKRKHDDLKLFWTGGFESLTFVESTVNQGKPINILAQSFHVWFTEQIERERERGQDLDIQEDGARCYIGLYVR